MPSKTSYIDVLDENLTRCRLVVVTPYVFDTDLSGRPIDVEQLPSIRTADGERVMRLSDSEFLSMESERRFRLIR